MIGALLLGVLVGLAGAAQAVGPTADLVATPGKAEPGETVQLDASGSSPGATISSYEYDWTGDGTYDLSTSEATVSHTYPDSGSYEPTVRVTTETGGTDTASRDVEIRDNQAPDAAFDWIPTEPVAGQRVELDPSGSSDPDGSIAEFRWDLDADGQIDRTVEPGDTHPSDTIDQAGDYPVRLVVADDWGDTAEVTRTVQVAPNDKPEASLNGPSKAAREERVRLDASGSQDPDGSITAYRWDLDGDGQQDRETEEPILDHSYGRAGMVEITVTVADDHDVTTSASHELHITDNEAPRAKLTISPDAPTTDDNVTLDASGSTDDSGIDSASYDVDGDGEYDIGPTHRAKVVFSPEDPIETTVRLRITDDEGAEDLATADLKVTEAEDGGGSGSLDDSSKSADQTSNDDGKGGSETGDDGGTQLGSSGDDTFGDGSQATSSDGSDADRVLRRDAGSGARAELTVSPGQAEVNETVRLRVDVEGARPAAVIWEVDGSPVQGDRFLERSFAEPGNHTVEVRVTTGEGDQLRDRGRVHVSENSTETGDEQPADVAGPGAWGLVVGTLAAVACRRRGRG